MSSGWLPPVPMTPQQVPDSVGSFEDSRSMQEHVASLASPILVVNADLCDERTVFSLGIEWITINDLPVDIRKDVGPALNMEEVPSILFVQAGSAADKAGLRNDLLVAVNDVSIKEDRLQTRIQSQVMGERPYRRYLSEILAKASEECAPARLSFQRGEVDNVVELQPQKQCKVRVVVTNETEKALSSDGGTIYIPWTL